MNPARIIAGLSILFLCALFFIIPLSAEEVPGSDKESLLNEDYIHNTESGLSDEPSLVEESLLSEESSIDDQIQLAEENPGEDASSLTEESLPEEESVISEENPPVNDNSISEEYSDDDDYILFEAPPLVFEAAPFYGTRSFDQIFPRFSRSQRRTVLDGEGLRNSFEKGGSPELTPDPASGIDLFGSVMKKNPSHIVEVLQIVPYNERELDMLDIYNALGKIEDINNHPLYSNGREFYIFTDATRLESAKNRKPIPDPQPAKFLPISETMYFRLKEITIGNIYFRGDIAASLYGITYSITNFLDIRYFVFPVMKAERFSAIIYLEPIKEGVLLYCMSGFYLPGFFADRINLTPSINYRLMVLINWLTEGLNKQNIVN